MAKAQEDPKGAEIIRHLNEAKEQRAPLESHIRECYRYTFPLRGVQFSQSVTTNPTTLAQQAKAEQADIYDSTAPDACTVVAANIMASMTPAYSKWFDYQVEGDESDESEGNRWLDGATTKLHGMIHSSNFDAPAFEAMLDCVATGMFALFTDKGVGAPFQFELWPLATCYASESRRGGPVDTIYYEFSLSAEQAANEYGEEMLSERLRAAVKKSPQSRHAFVWCIRPRKVAKGQRLTAKERLMPFESWQVEVSGKKVVKSGGFHEFPVVFPRFTKIPGSAYATGPFANALPDTRTINEVKRLSLGGLDMAISGMYGAVDDGVLNPKTIRIGARKIITMRDKESFFPLNPAGKPEMAALSVDDLRKSIRRVLNADLLDTSTEKPAETATAWHYRMNLTRQLMGPSNGRIQGEYLQPLVARCFGIALREGWLGLASEIPEVLRGKDFRLQYISPLARAQRMEDVAAMDRYEADLLAKAQARPDVLDVYDFDAAARKKAQLLGVPAKLVVPEDKVMAKREARAKLRQEQQTAALAAAAQKATPAPLPAAD